MTYMKKMPRDLQLGDVIVELDESGKVKYRHGKRLETKVTKIEHYACSKQDTHVNGHECYAYCVPVTVAV